MADLSEVRRRLQEAHAAKLERQAARENQAVDREVQRRVRRARVPKIDDLAALPTEAVRQRKDRAQREADRLKEAALERWAAAEDIEAQLALLEPDPPTPPTPPTPPRP